MTKPIKKKNRKFNVTYELTIRQMNLIDMILQDVSQTPDKYGGGFSAYEVSSKYGTNHRTLQKLNDDFDPISIEELD